ncbi:hypothetical protein DFH11DRAFT_1504541 [Phellopilus nigrolimitatus]|nr:hypothetical protein DFH11DRAFT_1504541 [Phellopilus nigrolimitatus]
MASWAGKSKSKRFNSEELTLLLVGCPTKLKPDGDTSRRICPRCNNASVFQAKSRTWFEVCWIPLIPMKSNQIWYCGMCHWQVPLQQG